MKAFWLDGSGVTALEEPLDDLLDRFEEFDTFQLDDAHEVYVEDQGLLAPDVVLATIGDRGRVPLPVLVLGFSGECSTDATITIERLVAMLRIEGVA